MDRGTWRATVHGVAKSRTLLSNYAQHSTGSTSGNESTCQCRRHKRCSFDPWIGKVIWRRKWQPTPISLPGKSHGQRSLVGYSPWGHKESDSTVCARARTHTHTHTHTDNFLASIPFLVGRDQGQSLASIPESWHRHRNGEKANQNV